MAIIKNPKFFLFSIFLLQFSVFTSMATYETPKPEGEEKKVDIIVEGMVYCQSCDHYGSWSFNGANPISSAKIGVICKNYRKQVTYYKAFETNENGYFFAQLSGFKMGNNILDHPLQACHVKLISSSQRNCSQISNINYGINGASLRFDNKILRGTHYQGVVYGAGPLAFHPDNCFLKY